MNSNSIINIIIIGIVHIAYRKKYLLTWVFPRLYAIDRAYFKWTQTTYFNFKTCFNWSVIDVIDLTINDEWVRRTGKVGGSWSQTKSEKILSIFSDRVDSVTKRDFSIHHWVVRITALVPNQHDSYMLVRNSF